MVFLWRALCGLVRDVVTTTPRLLLGAVLLPPPRTVLARLRRALLLCQPPAMPYTWCANCNPHWRIAAAAVLLPNMPAVRASFACSRVCALPDGSLRAVILLPGRRDCRLTCKADDRTIPATTVGCLYQRAFIAVGTVIHCLLCTCLLCLPGDMYSTLSHAGRFEDTTLQRQPQHHLPFPEEAPVTALLSL